jgi:predicted DNA-binding transcriptional regulator AlpA
MFNEKLTEVSAAVRLFDELPNSALVSIKTIAALEECSLSTVWRRIRSGHLPKPTKLGARTIRINVGEYREFRSATPGRGA